MEKSVQKKVYPLIIVLLLLVAFTLGYLTFALRHTDRDNESARPLAESNTLVLRSIPLEPTDISHTGTYVGYVTPIQEARIQPFINGYIDKINVSGGQYVKKGDLLLVLDQRQYQAELDASYAAFLKAQANFENARIYFNRIQNAGKSVSATEKDNARTQLLSSRAEYEQAFADYNLAKVNYDYTMIRSPIDGVTGNVFLTPGNYVSPDSGTLFSVMSFDPVRVVFSLTDKEYLQHLQNGNPVFDEKISLELADGQLISDGGRFAYFDNAVNQETDSVKVYADFRNIGQTLAPNSFVRVRLEKIFPNSLKIKQALVSLEEKGNFVYLIRRDTVRKVPVDILAAEDPDFIVRNTFEKNDRLILSPVTEQDIGQTVALSDSPSDDKGEK
jgi:RND family efflux transporter MFP subunit